jgi:hypothetical protein
MWLENLNSDPQWPNYFISKEREPKWSIQLMLAEDTFYERGTPICTD